MSSKIKKVEELEQLEWESTTRLIKDIIIEIKDEYPGITGDIILDKNNDIEVKFNLDKVTFKFQLQAQISDYTSTGVYKPPKNPAIDTDYKYHWGSTNNPLEQDVEVYVYLIKKSNGLIFVVSQQILSLTRTDGNLDTPTELTYKDWLFSPKQATVRFEETYLSKDDEVWIEISYKALMDNDNNGVFIEVKYESGGNYAAPKFIITNYRGIVDIKTVGVQYFVNRANPTIVENSEVFAEQFLPRDMSCKDFLLSIIRMFNLYIETDKEVEKKYYIEPRNDYYKDGSGGIDDYIDWTEKIDINTMEITPMGELNAKFYNFSYKTDNDYWNKRYRDETDNNYGSYTKEIENDFLTNEQKISTYVV